jgi:hypothetical protein
MRRPTSPLTKSGPEQLELNPKARAPGVHNVCFIDDEPSEPPIVYVSREDWAKATRNNGLRGSDE